MLQHKLVLGKQLKLWEKNGCTWERLAMYGIESEKQLKQVVFSIYKNEGTAQRSFSKIVGKIKSEKANKQGKEEVIVTEQVVTAENNQLIEISEDLETEKEFLNLEEKAMSEPQKKNLSETLEWCTLEHQKAIQDVEQARSELLQIHEKSEELKQNSVIIATQLKAELAVYEQNLEREQAAQATLQRAIENMNLHEQCLAEAKSEYDKASIKVCMFNSEKSKDSNAISVEEQLIDSTDITAAIVDIMNSTIRIFNDTPFEKLQRWGKIIAVLKKLSQEKQYIQFIVFSQKEANTLEMVLKPVMPENVEVVRFNE